jgi:hypothetical protein
MNLDLTREEFLTLIEAVHIASHVREDEMTSLVEKKILKCGFSAGLDGEIMADGDEFVLNNLISRALHEEIDAFEEDIFWSALSEELAMRDLRFIKAEEEISALKKDEYDKIIGGQAARYDLEFDEHGVTHLTLAHPLPLV